MDLRSGLFQLLHQLALIIRHAVFRFEIILDINAQPGSQQVTHMTNAGLHRIAVAQITADRPRLGRRFNDYKRTGPLTLLAFFLLPFAFFLADLRGLLVISGLGRFSWAGVLPMR